MTARSATMADGWHDFLRTWGDYRVEAEDYRELDPGRVLVLYHRSGHGKASGLELAQLRTKAVIVFLGTSEVADPSSETVPKTALDLGYGVGCSLLPLGSTGSEEVSPGWGLAVSAASACSRSTWLPRAAASSCDASGRRRSLESHFMRTTITSAEDAKAASSLCAVRRAGTGAHGRTLERSAVSAAACHRQDLGCLGN